MKRRLKRLREKAAAQQTSSSHASAVNNKDDTYNMWNADDSVAHIELKKRTCIDELN
jgi:hypothetical protein